MRSLLAVVMLASCASDPTLEVIVQHPDGVSVASTDVTVYESATLTCQDIEFGQLDAAQLAALATTDESIDGGGMVTGSLDGISRTENKVIVARGYNTTGGLIAAGCAQKATVSGKDSVTITTLIAATVALKPPADSSNLATMVTATDPDGNLIDGRAISWTVYGPAGSVPSTMSNVTVLSDGVWEPTMPTCTSQGVAQVHAAPPGSVSGYAVQMRVAWATEQPPIFTNLTNADFTVQSLPVAPAATVSKYCAIRHAGAMQRLVCFDGANNAHDFAVAVSGNKATLTEVGAAQAVPATTVAVLSLPIGTDLDVYAIDDNGDLTALFGAPAPTNTGTLLKCALAHCVDDAIVLPPCGPGADGRIFIHTGLATAKSLDYSGALQGSVPLSGMSAKLDSAGCVTQLQSSGSPTLVQAASLFTFASEVTMQSNADVHLIGCNNNGCAAVPTNLTRGATIGFTGGTEPRLVATSVDATGVVLLQVVLSASSGTIERSRMDAAALPDQIIGGQFDGDQDPDVVWDITTSRLGANFEVAYARDVNDDPDDPLEALSPASAVTVNDLVVGDLNGDGLDDLVALANDGTTSGVALVPMGVPVPVSVPADTICSP